MLLEAVRLCLQYMGGAGSLDPELRAAVLETRRKFESCLLLWTEHQAENLGAAFGITQQRRSNEAVKKEFDRRDIHLYRKRSLIVSAGPNSGLTLGFRVYRAIKRAEKAGESINEELFQKIGGRFCIGRTLVERYYRHVRDALRALDKESETISQFPPKV